jgi:hypothetical protein
VGGERLTFGLGRVLPPTADEALALLPLTEPHLNPTGLILTPPAPRLGSEGRGEIMARFHVRIEHVDPLRPLAEALNEELWLARSYIIVEGEEGSWSGVLYDFDYLPDTQTLVLKYRDNDAG